MGVIYHYTQPLWLYVILCLTNIRTKIVKHITGEAEHLLILKAIVFIENLFHSYLMIFIMKHILRTRCPLETYDSSATNCNNGRSKAFCWR